MTRRAILIGLVVGVNLAAALWFHLHDPDFTTASAPLFLLGVAHAQTSLLAFWAVFGGRATPWRLVCVIASVVAMLWWAVEECRQSAGYWASYLQIVPIGASLMLARFLGVGLSDIRASETIPSHDPERPWVQFSIGSLLSWTAALAVVFGLSQYLPERIVRGLGLENIRYLVFISLVNIVIAMGVIRVTLTSRRLAAIFAALTLAGIATVILLLAITGAPPSGLVVEFCGAEVVCMAGSLWLVRLAGYRLVWRQGVRP